MKTNCENRLRFTPTGMQVRENENGGESRTIEGCAIVFNRETTLWDGHYTRVREIIAPSCIDKTFLREQDVKLNIMHDRAQTIARRTKQGEGKLKLDLREDGLYMSCELPDTEQSRQIIANIRDKVYAGMSFEFFEGEFNDQVTTLPDGREDRLRTQTKFKKLTALTIALDPAYSATSIGAREGYEAYENEVKQLREAASAAEDMAHREKESKAAEEAAMAEREIRERQYRQMQMRMQMRNI